MRLQDELDALDRIALHNKPAPPAPPSPALRAELERAERAAILFGPQPDRTARRSRRPVREEPKPTRWVAPELAQFLDQAVHETFIAGEPSEPRGVVGLLNNPFLRGQKLARERS